MSEKECLLCLRTPIEKILGYSEKLYGQYIDKTIAPRVAKRAAKLIYSAYKKNPYEMCGPSPRSIIGSALYLSSIMEKRKRSQKMIQEVVGVSSASIRHTNKKFKKVLDLDVDTGPKPSHKSYDPPLHMRQNVTGGVYVRGS